MDATVKMLTKEEKENVLLVLNEFTEEYKASNKSQNGLIATIKELTGRMDSMMEIIKSQQQATASAGARPMNEAIETGIER